MSFPTAAAPPRGFSSCTFLPTPVVFLVFLIMSILSCEVTSRCGCQWHFPHDEQRGGPSRLPVGPVCVLLWEIRIQVLLRQGI